MHRDLWTPLILLAGALLIGLPALRAEQEPPPVKGTIALEGTVNKTYAAANTVMVKAADGVEHLFHLTKRTVVHGAASADDDALSGLREGSRVVVHYAAESGEKTAVEVDRISEDGLRTMKGVVARVDRAGKRLTLRLADGSIETLQLSERAASDVGKDIEGGATVTVYYADEAGRRVAHYFKKVS